MQGLLSEGQNTAAPSPGPGPQTPPAGGPGAGTPPSGGASGPGQPPSPQGQASASPESLRDDGIRQLYGNNFDQMIAMFETNGATNFPRSMAIAVNSTLDFLEKKHGALAPEQAAQVGMDVMMMLLEDIIGEGVVPDVTLEQVQQAFPAILVMYADSHPNVSKQDVQELVQTVQQEVSKAEGGGQAPGPAPEEGPPPPLNTGPRPPPGNTPVPPGIA